jgi:hypothetical protein
MRPLLSRVSTRLRATRGRTVAIRLRCVKVGRHTLPGCHGTLRLEATMAGKRTVIGRRSFAFLGSSRTLGLKLGSVAAAKLPLRATLTATVLNTGASSRTATKKLRILRPR